MSNVCEHNNILDICIDAGTSFTLPLLVRMDDGVTPVDITSWQISGSVKQSIADVTALLAFTGSIVNGISGSAEVMLSPQETWTLNNVSGAVYDIISREGSTITRILQGQVSIQPGVTAP